MKNFRQEEKTTEKLKISKLSLTEEDLGASWPFYPARNKQWRGRRWPRWRHRRIRQRRRALDRRKLCRRLPPAPLLVRGSCSCLSGRSCFAWIPDWLCSFSTPSRLFSEPVRPPRRRARSAEITPRSADPPRVSPPSRRCWRNCLGPMGCLYQPTSDMATANRQHHFRSTSKKTSHNFFH